MSEALRVFCSYRSADAAAVEPFARRLREEAGIDAWLDKWEIGPGDDIVARMDAGLDGCEAALVFLSRSWPAGAWARDEDTTLWYRRIEERIRVVPVVVDELPDGVPARLLKLGRRSIDQFADIRDALLGVDRRPGLRAAGEAVARTVSIAVAQQPDGAARVQVSVDGEVRAVEADVPVPGGVALIDAVGLQLLGDVGRRVGGLIYRGGVGEAVAAVLDELAVGSAVELRVGMDGPGLAGVPVEAGVLADGRIPALTAGVRFARVVSGTASRVPAAMPGPLKVLVAVGAPDEGLTRSAPLDIEAEMGSILGAVGAAFTDKRAEVRVLEVANAATIAAALREDAYHVLHLSGHGSPSAIELEDQDGGVLPTSAASLAEALRATGAALPLVFLSACHSAGDSAGLATELVRAGVPRVLAMQAPVSDGYATDLAHAFYEHLSRVAWPRAGVALALARQALQTREDRPRAEWAVPTLLLAGDDAPLLDSDLDQVPLRRPPVHTPAAGPVPALDLGRLVGRRREVRGALRSLRGDRAFTAAHGEAGAVVLTGIGGVGKSTIAGRVIARLSEDGWVCSVTAGDWSLETVCRQLARDLGASPLADRLVAADADELRLRALQDALRQRVLLVFDNYEDNLTDDGAAFRDEAQALVVQELVDAASPGKLLITSRHPLPGVDGVHDIVVGPLSAAESQRLWLRLPALERLSAEDQRLVSALIGGHPRMLEILDALLRRGAGVSEIRPKLRDLAQREAIDTSAERDLHAAISDATRLGARDILLDTLLAALDAAEREVLLQTAVSNLPVPLHELAVTLPDIDVEAAAQRLRDLSLLVTRDDGVWVHRWTAEALRSHQPADDHRDRCRRAGEMRLRQIAAGPAEFTLGIEATESFLAAEEYDAAAHIGYDVVRFLERSSTSWCLSVAGRVVAALPDDHPFYNAFVDHEAMGLLRLGFSAAALERYTALLRRHEQIVEAMPHNADRRHDLGVSYTKVAELLGDLGDGEQALALYTKASKLFQRLVEDEPERPEYVRDLAISYDSLGELLQDGGDHKQALELYAQSLEIAERLATGQPEDVGYQRDLSVSYNKMGDALQQLGEVEKARRFFTQSLQIREHLAAAEPDRADAQRDLSLSYHWLGDLLRDLGEHDQARELYERRRAIAERLVAAEPERADYQRDLATADERLGGLLRALGQREQAEDLFVRNLQIRRQLSDSEPQRADYQFALVVAYQRLGVVLTETQEYARARECYVSSLEIAERLVSAEPQRADYQRGLSIARHALTALDSPRRRKPSRRWFGRRR
jgi:tetratricopeptide (TPR) repeat protein